ncbi:MAG: hypothetical protein WCL13_02700 [bacterium]
MLRRIGKVNIGIFGNFFLLGAHIILDYLFDDKEVDGFVYKKKPSSVDFKIFSMIICSVDVFIKFEVELVRLAKKRKVIIIHEQSTTKIKDEKHGIKHLYICHGQKVLIDADHKDAIKNPSGYIKK